MSARNDRPDLPLLLLYNLDPAWPQRDQEEAQQEARRLEAGLRTIGHPVTSLVIDSWDVAAALSRYSPEDYIVFNWCEGVPRLPWSDALVAETLEMLNFAYTGAPPEVLSTCQDKALVKRQLERHHFTTPRWRPYASPDCDDWVCFPAIVKPSRVHCSFGVTSEAVVLSSVELRKRITSVLDEFHQPALVEDFIDGREFHVSLWGNGTIQMLPPAEMDFAAFDSIRDRLCTYEAKFDPTSRHYRDIQLRLPATLTDAEC